MRGWWPLLWMLLAACGGGTRAVYFDAEHGAPGARASRAEPVVLDEDGFKAGLSKVSRGVRPPARPQEAARKLFQVGARGGTYLVEEHGRRITPMGPGEHLDSERPATEVELTRAYLRWCERTGRKGDCLRLLMEGPTVTGDGHFTLALALAQGAVLEEMLEAFRGMAEPEAMLAAALWTMTAYAILWSVPEPLTKGVAATLTVGLIGYVGVDTFWQLIQGFRRLLAEAEQATSFDELRDAGERYGKVMGRNAARAFAMLAAAAVGSTAEGLASKLPVLPGAAQAAVRAEAQAGVSSAVAGQVEMVAVSAEGLTVGFAPGAVAMASGVSGFRAWKSHSGFRKAMGKAGPGKEWHHVVEQTPGNVQRFGREAIHNTRNVVPLDEALHRRVSAFYSSIRERITGSDTLTVRQWLSTKSYEAQRDFGLLAMQNIRTGLWQ